MFTTINGKTFSVTQSGSRFYYWSPLACRRLPVAKAKVEFYSTNRPGDAAAIVAMETGMDYSSALIFCNMD